MGDRSRTTDARRASWVSRHGPGLGPLADILLYEFGLGIPYALGGVLLAFVALWTSEGIARKSHL
ncbi:hypothetical protein D5W68_01880 [Salmonella enterica subsp. enterica serovar Minnesota]|nr:hypothetical protein [Salmonella enterica subsp. enterica serovar Minnesota]